GGEPLREAPPPVTLVIPAPVGGWRLVVRREPGKPQLVDALPPGAALDAPEAVRIHAQIAIWMPHRETLLLSTVDHITPPPAPPGGGRGAPRTPRPRPPRGGPPPPRQRRSPARRRGPPPAAR